MSLRDKISVDDTTNNTVSIDKYSYRREITLRNDGPNRCWIGFNEAAVADSGLYIDYGESVNFSRLKSESDIYLGCSAGESCTIYVQK